MMVDQLKVERFRVDHAKTCSWNSMPEGLCDCVKIKLIELFNLLDELSEENAELMKERDQLKLKRG